MPDKFSERKLSARYPTDLDAWQGLKAHFRDEIKALTLRQADYKFGHAAVHDLGPFRLLDSYHCSRYNTQTRRLSADMFRDIFRRARELLDAGS